MVDQTVGLVQVLCRKTDEAEPISRHATERPCGLSGPPVDDGVANEHSGRWSDSSACHQVSQSVGRRLPRKRTIAADNADAKIAGQIEAVENRAGGCQRFVCKHSQRHARVKIGEQFRNARVGARESQQATVIKRQESRKGVDGLQHRRCGEYTGDQRGRPIANHAADRFFSKRRCAAFLEEPIRRLGEIAPRINECSIQIKNDQAEL